MAEESQYALEYANYIKDSRTACKYGAKCYQKNPIHAQKYKHPPKKNKQQIGHVNKKIKIQKVNKETKQVATSNDVSDSDEYNIDDDSDISLHKNYEQLSDSESEESENISNKKHKDKTNNTNGITAKPMVQVSNDVSESDYSEDDTIVDKNKIIKHEGTISDINEMATKPSTIQVNNDISQSDDLGDDTIEDKNKERNVEDKRETQEHKGKRISDKLDYREFIKEKFLVDMPEDFYQFWNYCKKVTPKDPLNALKDIGLKLVGPFDVLAGKFENVIKSEEEFLLHWRFYHDPPELQTVLKGEDKIGFHIGYFRDSPDEPPVFLVSNSAKKDGMLRQMGPNIFASVNMYLEDLKKAGDPFKKMHIGRIQSSIKKEAENLKLDLSPKTNAMVSREKKIVTRTFNKIGLVVPYNRKTQLGYRELALDNKDLNTLLTKLKNALLEQRSKYLAELQPVFTFASIATDECDFGTGIELGWNIISHGVDSLNSTALRFLATNYRLLNKEAFAKIAEAHMANRKKGCDLSIV